MVSVPGSTYPSFAIVSSLADSCHWYVGPRYDDSIACHTRHCFATVIMPYGQVNVKCTEHIDVPR